MRRFGGAVSLALAACLAACVPTGDAPTGRQLTTGRTRDLIGILPARSPGEAPRLLVTGRRPEDDAFALYLITAPADGMPAERLLAVGAAPEGCWERGPCILTDSRGRLLLSESETVDLPGIGPASRSNSILVDPDSGERWELGGGGAQLSPSRERIVVFRHEPGGIILRESDDRTTLLADALYGMFLGEDYYYIDDMQRLRRVPASGIAELVREQVVQFTPLSTADGPLLQLWLASAEPFGGPISLYDPATGQERLLTPEVSRRFAGISPDRRWLVLGDAMGYGRSRSLIELATGAEEPFELPAEPAGPAEWRPGRDEYWMFLYHHARNENLTAIKKPGSPLIMAPGGFTGFLRDGSLWFSSRQTEDRGRYALHAGPADNPADPGVRLSPPGSMSFATWSLADGRLLLEASYGRPDRGDLIAVEPGTGDAQLLAQDGKALDVGPRRVLAALRLLDGHGDVAAIDLESGRVTVLAAEFATAAYVQPEAWDPDRVKPGAPVAYRFRARFASSYDGIWLTTLP